jgi:hypothetical protein
MKYHVKQFKSLAAALKEIEPFVRNGQHLQTGKPFEKFGGMRSREILANFTFSASSRLFDLNGETKRVKTKQRSAIIAADVRRFSYLINTDQVFGTHR